MHDIAYEFYAGIERSCDFGTDWTLICLFQEPQEDTVKVHDRACDVCHFVLVPKHFVALFQLDDDAAIYACI